MSKGIGNGSATAAIPATECLWRREVDTVVGEVGMECRPGGTAVRLG